MTAVTPELLRKVDDSFEHAVLIFVASDGYPVGVATDYDVDAADGSIKLRTPAGIQPPTDHEVDVIVSHIRPMPEMGYDERRYVNLWGRLTPEGSGVRLRPDDAQTWDEQVTPFFQYSEVTVPQAHKYMADLSDRQGRPVKPRLAAGWLFLRATRLPFLSATAIPVFLGIAAAALDGAFDIWLGLLTLLAASFVHLGLNIANDIFDTLSGADAANETPTQFSGGSRVIHYGLLSMKQMAAMSIAFYTAAIAIGLWLAAMRGFWPLFWIGFAGVAISIIYTAPPLRLVHRGVGEIAVGVGFGPLMVVGAYFVQAQTITGEAWYLSIPIAILIALVLYVNEIPDRAGDAKAGKRTLPVRWSKSTVVTAYAVAVGAAYLSIAVGAAIGILPRETLVGLVTIPLAVQVYRGVRDSYENAYALMPTMAKGVNLHLLTGLALLVGYIVAIVLDRI